ncbi:MAG: DUF362 domain-containing protein [archaeon]
MTLELNQERCLTCGGCISICPVGALEIKNKELTIDHEKCIECGTCVKFCPVNSLKINKEGE